MNTIKEFTFFKRDEQLIGVGEEGGACVERNTLAVSGGGYADVSSAWVTRNYIGKGNKGREFMTLGHTISHQDEGEAVDVYRKVEKRGRAPVWVGVDEVFDDLGLEGAAVGREIDMFVTGFAADPFSSAGDQDNGGRMRIGHDFVGGDEQARQGKPTQGASATAPFRVGKTANGGMFSWLYGGIIGCFKRAGLVFVADGAERFLWFKGRATVGLDFSGADLQSVIRMKAGDRITFEGTDSIGISYRDGFLVFDNCGRPFAKWDVNKAVP